MVSSLEPSASSVAMMFPYPALCDFAQFQFNPPHLYSEFMLKNDLMAFYDRHYGFLGSNRAQSPYFRS